ncbi:hypothetical protein CR513_27415, partial [Mucuna pruriens]
MEEGAKEDDMADRNYEVFSATTEKEGEEMIASELQALQKKHEEKNLKIHELKRQIELTKHRLEKKKKEVKEEQ